MDAHECAQRTADEMEAMMGLFGDRECSLSTDAAAVREAQKRTDAAVFLSLHPEHGYPERSLAVRVTAPNRPREAIIAQDRAQAAAAANAAVAAESMFQAAEAAREAFAESVAAQQDCAGEGASASAAQAVDRALEVVEVVDHMRDRARYTAALRSWAGELGVRVVAAIPRSGRRIVVLVRGEESDVRVFVKRQRTRPVDVDSRGRACREKQMRVEAEVKVHGPVPEQAGLLVLDAPGPQWVSAHVASDECRTAAAAVGAGR